MLSITVRAQLASFVPVYKGILRFAINEMFSSVISTRTYHANFTVYNLLVCILKLSYFQKSFLLFFQPKQTENNSQEVEGKKKKKKKKKKNKNKEGDEKVNLCFVLQLNLIMLSCNLPYYYINESTLFRSN